MNLRTLEKALWMFLRQWLRAIGYQEDAEFWRKHPRALGEAIGGLLERGERSQFGEGAISGR